MPHITVEYSANLEPRLHVMDLLRVVHHAALASGLAELEGLRTLAERREYTIVADGDPMNGFVAIRARIGAGRDAATRTQFARMVFDAATAILAPIHRTAPLAISFEVAEIDPVGSLTLNNLHARMQARQSVSV